MLPGSRVLVVGLSALLLASCGDSASTVDPQERAERGPTAVVDAGEGRPSWGPSVPLVSPPAALEAELRRAPDHPGLVALLDDRGGPGHARALWSLARIGGPAARDRLLAELDAAEGEALAAVALLEPPPRTPGSPPDPLEGGAWGALEDALWTRYAVSEPSQVGRQRALVLAIARVGGSRSVGRFAVELAELPGPDHPPAVVARWSAAARALGLLCARGFALDEAGAAIILDGLELDAPQASAAALYTLGRCARSSSERLAESRELLVRRLEPHVEAAAAARSPEHAALAWKAFGALGELPEAVPATILAADPPSWTVEVEAARALGASVASRALVRRRLAALSIEAFAGPRQHVLLAALQSQRAGVGADPAEADAQLLAIEGPLLAGRRGDDPRLRKLAALARCELRLLQAIRSGSPELVRSCEQVRDAPALDPLPASLLAGLEVEALLHTTRPVPGVGKGEANLGTAQIDEDAALVGEGDPAGPSEPGAEGQARRTQIASLLAMAREDDPARAAAALHALAEVDDPGVLPILRAALTREDPGVLAAAATAVAVRSVDAAKRDLEAVPLLEKVVRERDDAGTLEARLAAIEGLGALARSAVAAISPDGPTAAEAPPDSPWLARTILPLARDPAVAVRRKAREALLGHADLLGRFDAAARAAQAEREGPVFDARVAEALAAQQREPATGLRLHTSAGSFRVDFSGVAAPINQANLAALAGAGFYDGLGFHRVVPGFVVQGGDPRGDGYGGPGYLVPCEWSNLRYERGTVGIALAGKDTGGSQIFVAHTAQPHLDARYTVVGQVDEADMAVVDRLLPGDRIESVEVLRETGAPEGEEP